MAIIAARLKGGREVHALDIGENNTAPKSGALCGRKPSQSRHSSMNRAGWYGYKSGTVAITCPECLKLSGVEKP